MSRCSPPIFFVKNYFVMGCGASAQVSAEDGEINNDEGHEGDANGDEQGAEANGLQQDLELADFDRSSANFTHGDGPGRLLDKAPLPPIKKTGAGDTGSIISLDSHESFSQNRPRTGVPSYRSPRKLPKLVGGITPHVDASLAEGIAHEIKMAEEALIEQDEDEDFLSTEEKGTNTVDIMQDSFETVELGEDAQFTNDGQKGEVIPEESLSQEKLSIGGEEEEEIVFENKENVEDDQEPEHDQEIPETTEEVLETDDQVPENSEEIEAELEDQIKEAEQLEEAQSDHNEGEIVQVPDFDGEVPDECENKSSEVPNESVPGESEEAIEEDHQDAETEPQEETGVEEPETAEDDNAKNQEVVDAQEDQNEDEADDDDDVVHTPAPSRPTSSTSRRTAIHADQDSRAASGLSVTQGIEAASRPNSAASLTRLSMTSRRGSSASGGTRGDVEDECDGVTSIEKKRISNRKKMGSAPRVRIAEGHELMETPTPNDSGADLAADEDHGDQAQEANRDPLYQTNENGDESGLDNQESDYDQDIPITNLSGYSRSNSSVQVTG